MASDRMHRQFRFLFSNVLTLADKKETSDHLESKSQFERAADGSDPGLLREFWWFVCYNKKWWLVPILVIFVALVALAFFTNSPAAPFIYTLF